MGDREALGEAWSQLQQRLRVQSLTPPEGASWEGQNGPEWNPKQEIHNSDLYR